MTYKDSLFFIAKCLTISLEEKNRKEVEEELKAGNIDWESIVKVSTAHLVFPALYCNLKRAVLLRYLPVDLIAHMQYITKLNRKRNTQIIAQAQEINTLLTKHQIPPIFLKGTGNLLENLYEDPAERMVGDIDFILSPAHYPIAIEVLMQNSYSKVHKTTYDYPHFRHYPRLRKKGNIAAVEIHKELLVEKYANEFNYALIAKDTQKVKTIHLLSFQNQLALSIIAVQINDDGFQYKNISLRNAYDVFLLSKKTDAKEAFNKFERLKHPLNSFLAICFEVFSKPETLKYHSSLNTNAYLNAFYEQALSTNIGAKRQLKTTKQLFISKRLIILKKSIFNKAQRKWLLKRISDAQWRKEKLIQIGIRKA